MKDFQYFQALSSTVTNTFCCCSRDFSHGGWNIHLNIILQCWHKPTGYISRHHKVHTTLGIKLFLSSISTQVVNICFRKLLRTFLKHLDLSDSSVSFFLAHISPCSFLSFCHVFSFFIRSQNGLLHILVFSFKSAPENLPLPFPCTIDYSLPPIFYKLTVVLPSSSVPWDIHLFTLLI